MIARRDAWGLTAVVIGAWEAVALASHRRVPTVTTLCRRAPRCLVAAWIAALAHHLLWRGDR